MLKKVGCLISLAVLAGAAASPVALAGNVNCKLVMKNLAVGRTPAQVAETMVISEDDVKKCMEAEKAKAAKKGEKGESGHGEHGHHEGN